MKEFLRLSSCGIVTRKKNSGGGKGRFAVEKKQSEPRTAATATDGQEG